MSDAALAALREAANRLVDFHNMGASAQRPDMHHRLIVRLAGAIDATADAAKRHDADVRRKVLEEVMVVSRSLDAGLTAGVDPKIDAWLASSFALRNSVQALIDKEPGHE